MLGVFFHLLREAWVHVYVILAIGAALGAYFASGILRVTLIVWRFSWAPRDVGACWRR